MRRYVVSRLVSGEATVGDLAEPLGITTAGMMKHLTVLEGTGLVKTEKRGRSRYCRLEPEPMATAQEWMKDIRAFWMGSFERLGDYLETMDK